MTMEKLATAVDPKMIGAVALATASFVALVPIAQHIPERTNPFEVSHTLSIGHWARFSLILLVPMSLLSSL